VNVTLPPITRRAWLLASATALSCGRKRATGFAGFCFVGDEPSRSLTVVDLQRFKVTTRIKLDAVPTALIAGPSGSSPRLFALAPEAGSLYEIDAGGLELKRKIAAGTKAIAMRMAPGGGSLWTLYREPAALVQIRLDEFRAAKRIPLLAMPDSFDANEDGKAVVANVRERSITTVSLARGAVERTFATAVEPSMVRLRKDGRHVIVFSAPERCAVVHDAATGQTVVRLPLPIAPRNLAVTPDRGQIFISGEGADSVSVLFPYATEIGEAVLAGHAPGAMIVTDTSPQYLMVANPTAASVTVLDVDSRRMVAVVHVGGDPEEMLITPDNQYVLIVGKKSADLGVLRIATLQEDAVRRYKSAPVFNMISLGGRPTAAAVTQRPA
jgi:DNA-binding beta-propeller fold protein YncE